MSDLALYSLQQQIVTPQTIMVRQTMADGIIAVAARMQDWTLLDEAIRLKIEDQRWFIEEYWIPIVKAAHGGDRSKVAPNATLTVRERIEIESGVSRWQVSRWNVGLRDEQSYHEEIARAARMAAGLEESERAKRDAEVKRRRRLAIERGQMVPLDERCRLVNASVTAMPDEPTGSIDVIVTDPPYPQEYLPLFGDLARGAAHVLKPGGLMLCMSGQTWLPEVLDQMRGHGSLGYLWIAAYLTPGGQSPQIYPRRAQPQWKPVLLFCNGKFEGEWYSDVVRSDPNDNDKEHHYWGQSLSGMRDLMRQFVLPGQTVCDPFLGGGTTAIVALEMGAAFLGFDIDPDALSITRARLADVTL